VLFDREVYLQRRSALRRLVSSGVALFLGNDESPMNYADNPYPFRQDSTFLYFFGIDRPGLAALVDLEQEREILFGDDRSVEEAVWMGPGERLVEVGGRAGVRQVLRRADLEEAVRRERASGRKVHVLPPYRPEHVLKLAFIFKVPPRDASRLASEELIRAVVELRSRKGPEEIEQLEEALELCAAMQLEAMKRTRPGVLEREVVSAMEGLLLSKGSRTSFPTIFTMRGEILHNHYHGNVLQPGGLVINDSGAESPAHYAGDITRTLPVSGKFDPLQRDVYQLVLKAQQEALAAMKPGVLFRNVHLLACRVLTEGLIEMGLMRGDPEEAVAAGAHALFFPCGLGHMIGLDVHDMEGLGEDYVGYTEKITRSSQFGLKSLRMARALEESFCVTVEPGLYFNPFLAERWRADGLHRDFIDYGAFEKFSSFGGIRIEDDVVVTREGARILGPPIPKKIEEIEQIMS